eukprot:TRINITY_DN4431_c0_g1_i4.p1 TRINITY_DN4431_c0_g1~~TRINITY_DN4431_c0_g1_i4.p1  ORF type:complete len:498 (+),score=140.33 TRINITY_DN4431_c0_g1_i4:150-1643(+)
MLRSLVGSEMCIRDRELKHIRPEMDWFRDEMKQAKAAIREKSLALVRSTMKEDIDLLRSETENARAEMGNEANEVAKTMMTTELQALRAEMKKTWDQVAERSEMMADLEVKTRDTLGQAGKITDRMKAQRQEVTDEIQKSKNEELPDLPQVPDNVLEDWRRKPKWNKMPEHELGMFGAMRKSLLPTGKRLIVVWQALHRGGNALLWPVMNQICAHMRLPVYTRIVGPTPAFLWDITWNLLENVNVEEGGQEDRQANSLVYNVPDGESGCVGVMRTFDPPPPQKDTVYKVITVLRDPRDTAVSAYFSFGWTDPQAKNNWHIRKLSVDEFALKEAPNPGGLVEIGTAKFYKALWAPLLDSSNVHGRLLLPYDGLVTAYREMLAKIATHLKVPREVSEMVYHSTCCTSHDSPTRLVELMARGMSESTSRSGVRSFLPGGYKLRLSRETNEKLKEMFAKELELINSVWSWDAYCSFPPPRVDDNFRQQLAELEKEFETKKK